MDIELWELGVLDIEGGLMVHLLSLGRVPRLLGIGVGGPCTVN